MPSPHMGNRWNVVAAFILIAALLGALRLAPLIRGSRRVFAASPAQQQHHPFPTNPSLPSPPVIAEPPKPMSPKQKEKLMKFNFQKTQRDADQLFDLAKALKEDLDKSNANILSVKIVNRASKIEKLAKKIRSEAVND